MIHYHGMPLSGSMGKANEFLTNRHAFVSHASPECLPIVAECSQSFALDNGAFSAWKAGKAVDWQGYYDWVDEWRFHPGFDWAVIPDVIDGTPKDNDELIARWPHKKTEGVPVWHFHEPIPRLVSLCGHWPRVALGSSGEWPTPGNEKWWDRVNEFMEKITQCGRPMTKLHGLRMLDPEIFSRLPLSSADSTNAARNCGMTGSWKVYMPPTNIQRAEVIAGRVEAWNSAPLWKGKPKQNSIFDLFNDT